LGKTDTYTLSFDMEPIAGINFSMPIVHDYSINSNVWPDFTADLTRSADFDGEYVLLVSRSGGNNPKLLPVDEILSNSAINPIALKTDGIAGGTYVISSGRLMQGHIYICNLTTGLADTDAGKLKLYHYAGPTATPELILDFAGVIDESTTATGRYGDNISIDLDEDGNGYVFFVMQDPGTQTIRFKVTNFTTVGEPALLTPAAASYYACYNQVGSENAYLYTSTNLATIQLLDKDGQSLTYATKNGAALKGVDVQIAQYNSGRYMMMTTGRRYAADAPWTLFIYDLTEGMNTVAALAPYQEELPEPVYSYAMDAPFTTAPGANTAWAVVDGKLCIFASAPMAGFVLVEFPKNQK
jgi:hypothetical protein